MKKTLLVSVALAASCSAFAAAPGIVKADKSKFIEGPKAPALNKTESVTRSEGDMESFDFTYASDPYTAFTMGNNAPGGTRVYLAFMMNADDIKTFAGSKVTGFTVYSPTNQNGTSNSITDARFFYSTDPQLTEADYSQDFTMTRTAYGTNKIVIDEPYTITGEEEALFFGYSLVVPKKNDMYYAVIDYIANEPTTGIVGVAEGDSFPAEFDVFGDYYGALCMAVTLEREHLPKFVNFTSFPATMALPLGEPAAYPVTLKATSGSSIESITLEYTLGGKPIVDEIAFEKPIAAGASKFFRVAVEFPAFNEKINEDVEFKLTKINGIDNTGENMTADARVAVVDQLPARQTLIEEYTGTWCQFCTRGYAAMEYIRHNYPEFVTAAYHNEDPMSVVTEGYPANISGFPSASLNREDIYDPYYGSQMYDFEVPIIGDILAANAVPTPWEISVSHEWETSDVLTVKTQAANVAGFKDKDFKIAYLLIADGLSGKTTDWYQSNYYSTQNPTFVEELNAFCRGGIYGKSKVGGLEFNDVVISANGIYGMPGSIPATVEPYQTVEHSVKYDLSKIPSELIADRNKLRVVAAVLDADGVVLNSAKDEVDDFDANAVEGLDASDAPVEFYNLNGMKISQPTQGVFIRRQGAKADKVIIR